MEKKVDSTEVQNIKGKYYLLLIGVVSCYTRIAFRWG